MDTHHPTKAAAAEDDRSAAARELVQRIVVGRRYAWQIETAHAAALSHTGGDEAAALALLAAEAGGLYGRSLHYPGNGTMRHAAFRGLGKGRRRATDGEVWTRAIEEAQRRSGTVEFRPHEGGVTAVVRRFGVEGEPPEEYVRMESLLSADELAVLARRMLSRCEDSEVPARSEVVVALEEARPVGENAREGVHAADGASAETINPSRGRARPAARHRPRSTDDRRPYRASARTCATERRRRS